MARSVVVVVVAVVVVVLRTCHFHVCLSKLYCPARTPAPVAPAAESTNPIARKKVGRGADLTPESGGFGWTQPFPSLCPAGDEQKTQVVSSW